MVLNFILQRFVCFLLLQPGGDQVVLCFVDFTDMRSAATAMEALQGVSPILIHKVFVYQEMLVQIRIGSSSVLCLWYTW